MPRLTKISDIGLESLSADGSYQASAAIVWCMDRRARRARENLLQMLNYKLEDLIQVAGGVQGIVGRKPHARNYLLRQIELALLKHGAREIVLMTHQDCAMFKDKIPIGRDEMKFLARKLVQGMMLVAKHLEPLPFVGPVRGVLVGHAGTFEVTP